LFYILYHQIFYLKGFVKNAVLCPQFYYGVLLFRYYRELLADFFPFPMVPGQPHKGKNVIMNETIWKRRKPVIDTGKAPLYNKDVQWGWHPFKKTACANYIQRG